jgi:signal transduction histidine kinase/CheY-like chemotaxis protein
MLRNDPRPFRSIAQVLIRRILALALVILVLALCFQALWAQQENKQHFKELMQKVADTNVPMMSLALWDIEPQTVQAQLNIMAKRPEIGFVQLKAGTGQVFEQGDVRLLTSESVYRLNINAPQGNVKLGVLSLAINPAYFWRNFLDMAWQAAVGSCVLTALICLLIVVMLKRDLERPLQNMAQFVSDLSSDKLTETLPLDRRLNIHRDEIDLFAQAFTQLQQNLRQRLEDLNQLVEERTSQQEKLIIANQKSQVANLAKSQFLATISHELRTPLNGILGMAQLLKHADTTESQRHEFAQIILNSGKSLETLINDLLDISQIEANKLVLRSEPCDVVALTHDVTSLFFQAALSKNLKIEAKWLGEQGQLFRTDPIRLRQMLSNLLSNAIKFTEQGHVQIEGKEIEQNGAEAILEFSVTDSGIGIESDKLDLLFKRFSQVDSSHSRSFEGTGLGLSIVEGLAKRMGGHVGVESQYGVGSRFWFRIQVVVLDAAGNLWKATPTPLPLLKELTKSHRTPEVLSSESKHRQGLTVVVEDNPINQKIVESVLTRMGLQCVCFVNGQECVNAVLQGLEPQVILMDMQMPVMNGLEAARAIRAWEYQMRKKPIPIVGLTAGSGAGLEQECIDSGMDAVLFKPVDLDLLQSEVLQYVGHADKN